MFMHTGHLLFQKLNGRCFKQRVSSRCHTWSATVWATPTQVMWTMAVSVVMEEVAALWMKWISKIIVFYNNKHFKI